MTQPEKQTDLKKIKEFIELMKDNDLIELEIIDGDSKVHLKRPQPGHPHIAQVPVPFPTAQTPAPQAQAPQAAEPEHAEELAEVKSPIIGTFYSAPSPDSKPYVKVGSRVQPDTVVCIVEAMKVMNEIKAETSGTIVEILRKAGEAVDYGQVLFRVKPE